jgi:hypothetical protein
MLVKCIDNTDCPNCLTLGKEYKVVSYYNDYFTIIDNHNEEWAFHKKYFVVVKEKELVNG